MINLNRQKFETEFAGKQLSLEVSGLADQATSAVLGKYEETVVLVTVVMAKEDRPGDFFPLTVDYEERFYAAGKIIGSRFVRREGRPSEEAILSGRIIDRTIRPLFDHRMRRPVQVVVTVLSIDEKSDPDFIALLTASTALGISKIPWDGPVAGVRISGKQNGEFVFNSNGQSLNGDEKFSGFIAGTSNYINMIELEGIEADESVVTDGCKIAQDEIAKLVTWQKGIIEKIGKEKEQIPLADPGDSIKEKIRSLISDKLENTIYTEDKTEREVRIDALKKSVNESLEGEEVPGKELGSIDGFIEDEIDTLVHKNVIESDKRPDGRKLDQVRDLYAEIGLFERMHGSALFIRGNTQALTVTTLGPPNSEQTVESIEWSGKRRFLLHYNFPSYSVGETGTSRGPGRREIGHGALAGKALKNIIPSQEEFPYTIRVVSEILSSNGSSSMATVCSASLSLMDAGVPIKKPVAGIAMGLMSNSSGDYKILTDIQGPEDHFGDMDFKVAGTRDGVTAIQLDVKINGVTGKMIVEVLEAAKKARFHILDVMEKTIDAPRKDVSEFAPVILTTHIPESKIGEVIGPGGKMINGIIADTGALSIDIEQTGQVFITGQTKEQAEAALEMVKSIAKTFEVGEIVEGEIVRILDFGAIVQLSPHQDGMVHVSELKNGYVKNVTDVVKLGDHVRAKVIKVEEGKIGLSMKALEEKGPEPRQ
ncbi:MAG: polyribonucleotide nucleotidyltransferase [Candidatus Harrisonbacteria bacterium CG10_big_fil_rev_8_21_14_0_10_40_38]|uniref:Polyribonucleotide nucleotidyltransferase n=1 Tax=Candidatus Harrisonbacteria bacterium CG10_big_fil_rev_8_21_14_0_10_40_38 TaxID=1974583 RepID=A0A2H0URC1_9BACT|nr:MAG: polyribonucleotide nucleotidyltransferase [Candidatus Harrisonbacteria bacterium CG10_big_fil_rev_8_21_14_0_10_40_38]